METGFRQLDANEMGLLERLLSREFPGRDTLRLQLSSVTGRQIDAEGSVELKTGEDVLAEVSCRCPTEGICKDIDGGQIAVLLHVKSGKLHQLEILKEDGSELLRRPKPEDLKVY